MDIIRPWCVNGNFMFWTIKNMQTKLGRGSSESTGWSPLWQSPGLFVHISYMLMCFCNSSMGLFLTPGTLIKSSYANLRSFSQLLSIACLKKYVYCHYVHLEVVKCGWQKVWSQVDAPQMWGLIWDPNCLLIMSYKKKL